MVLSRPFKRRTEPFLMEEHQWFTFNRYEVDQTGNLVPIQRVRIGGYNPFEFYYSPVPQEIALHILSGRRLAGLGEKPFYLHTLWASLDPENTTEIVRFINHFGPPWVTWDQEFGPEPEDLERPLPLSEIQGELRLFSWLISIAAAFSSTKGELRDILVRGFKDLPGQDLAFDYELELIINAANESDDPIITAVDVLETVINAHLRHVAPKLIVGSISEWQEMRELGTVLPPSVNFSWEFDSLLSAMYLMLFLDLTQGKKLRKCAHIYCGRFFIANRDDTKYCSPQCQNRARIRRFTLRKKAKEAAPSSKPGANAKDAEDRRT